MAKAVMDIIFDAVIDCAKLIPFLFAVYLIIEYIEHRSADKFGKVLSNMGVFGSAGGALLGCVPQCGFSVMASNLFAGRLISAGTLVAVYVSTSDEAVPMMIAQPEKLGMLWKLLLAKVVIAVIAGTAVDLLLKLFKKAPAEEKPFEELCSHCGCGHHSIWVSALRHTGSIVLFILIVNILLNGAISLIGEDNIGSILMTNSFFQPFIAAAIGFIPNCAASVILTQLYIEGVLSFGAIVAGLCTGAGVGLVVLFRTNKHMKENLFIVAMLYVTAVISGIVINLF